jgi:hypothetical protein
MAMLPLIMSCMVAVVASDGVVSNARAVEHKTKEIVGVNSIWLTQGRSQASDVNLDFVPNPPEHGPVGITPPLLDANRDGSYSLWLRLDARHYRFARSGTLAQLDRDVATASKGTSGGEWVCVHGDQRSSHRQFLTLVRHLRDSGYPKVCVVTWRGDPGV